MHYRDHIKNEKVDLANQSAPDVSIYKNIYVMVSSGAIILSREVFLWKKSIVSI